MTDRKCPKCRRTMHVSGRSIERTFWKCKCGNEIQAPSRKIDRADLNSMFKPKPRNNVHLVWHEFFDKFHKLENTGQIFKINGKKKYIKKYVWKWHGYELMKRVEKWATKHPRDVIITRCDDHAHMGSYLVMIQHRALSGKSYMGTSMIFIPQTGEDPAKIFLYPNHHKQLIDALVNIKKRYHKKSLI